MMELEPSLIKMESGTYTTSKPASKVTYNEAAEILDLSKNTIWRMVKSGLLKTTKGGHITLGYLVEYLNSSK